MDWLSGNSFFVLLLLLCVGMHLFHGHGGHHDKHEDDDASGRRDDREH